MDDMTRFEQRMTDDALRVAGPPRSVDVDAVLAGITRSRPTRWRLQLRFSGVTAVVAGSIAVLFGGLLLAGVLMRSSDVAGPSPGTPTPSATATPTPPATPSAWSLEGFGQVTPVWTQFVVEVAGPNGVGNTQIDWSEPEGVIDRHLYTATCSPTCGGRLLRKDEMSIFPSQLDDPVVIPGGMWNGVIYPERLWNGVIYRQPPPPAEIQWLVELEYDPGHPGCTTLLDAAGRCIVDSGPWFWFRVAQDADWIVPAWGEDHVVGIYQGPASGRFPSAQPPISTWIGWWEPRNVVDRQLYYAICVPDCGGDTPTFEDMREYTESSIDGPSPVDGAVGTLFRVPEPGPAEIWWMVRVELDGLEDASGGPWRFFVADPVDPRQEEE